MPAFSQWSPLIPDGKGGYERDKSRKGEIFHRFVKAVCAFGYSAGWHEEKSCLQGDPTIRNRLFLVFRRDGEEVVFPEPTHGDPKSEAVKSGQLQPWPVAADILDFEDDCPSIFMTREEGREYTRRTGKRVVRPLARKSHARLAKGVKRHVIDAGDDAYIATLNHDGDGFRGQSLREPLRTVAKSRDAHGLVVPHVAVFRGDSDGKPVTDAMPTVTANSFIKRPGGARSLPIDRPMPTPVPDGNGGSLAAVYLAQHNGGARGPIGRPVDKPVATVMHEGSQQQVVAAHLTQFYGTNGGDIREPAPPATAGGNHTGIVTVPLVTAYYSTGGQDAPVGNPMLAVPTKARFGLTHVDLAPPPLTEAQWRRARQVAEFLREHGCWDGGEIVTVTIRGVVYIIVDIGMRMLKPRELARAQGFPEWYVLDPLFRGKPLSETEQRHKIGNSVTRKAAAAQIVANYRPPMEWGEEAFLEAAE